MTGDDSIRTRAYNMGKEDAMKLYLPQIEELKAKLEESEQSVCPIVTEQRAMLNRQHNEIERLNLRLNDEMTASQKTFQELERLKKLVPECFDIDCCHGCICASRSSQRKRRIKRWKEAKR